MVCINRNILECKDSRNIASMSKATVLIETYWNVKTDSLYSSRVVVPVLIETYWNVKRRPAAEPASEPTYWNVKVTIDVL